MSFIAFVRYMAYYKYAMAYGTSSCKKFPINLNKIPKLVFPTPEGVFLFIYRLRAGIPSPHIVSAKFTVMFKVIFFLGKF